MYATKAGVNKDNEPKDNILDDKRKKKSTGSFDKSDQDLQELAAEFSSISQKDVQKYYEDNKSKLTVHPVKALPNKRPSGHKRDGNKSTRLSPDVIAQHDENCDLDSMDACGGEKMAAQCACAEKNFQKGDSSIAVGRITSEEEGQILSFFTKKDVNKSKDLDRDGIKASPIPSISPKNHYLVDLDRSTPRDKIPTISSSISSAGECSLRKSVSAISNDRCWADSMVNFYMSETTGSEQSEVKVKQADSVRDNAAKQQQAGTKKTKGRFMDKFRRAASDTVTVTTSCNALMKTTGAEGRLTVIIVYVRRVYM